MDGELRSSRTSQLLSDVLLFGFDPLTTSTSCFRSNRTMVVIRLQPPGRNVKGIHLKPTGTISVSVFSRTCSGSRFRNPVHVQPAEASRSSIRISLFLDSREAAADSPPESFESFCLFESQKKQKKVSFNFLMKCVFYS
uniref:Uncharacterized protein n=1 Tax=Nothobranchius furzeri TaxID=105023 RepID=A0A1A8AWV0_NOTFU